MRTMCDAWLDPARCFLRAVYCSIKASRMSTCLVGVISGTFIWLVPARTSRHLLKSEILPSFTLFRPGFWFKIISTMLGIVVPTPYRIGSLPNANFDRRGSPQQSCITLPTIHFSDHSLLSVVAFFLTGYLLATVRRTLTLSSTGGRSGLERGPVLENLRNTRRQRWPVNSERGPVLENLRDTGRQRWPANSKRGQVLENLRRQ
jgi:hypothetical protein